MIVVNNEPTSDFRSRFSFQMSPSIVGSAEIESPACPVVALGSCDIFDLLARPIVVE